MSWARLQNWQLVASAGFSLVPQDTNPPVMPPPEDDWETLEFEDELLVFPKRVVPDPGVVLPDPVVPPDTLDPPETLDPPDVTVEFVVTLTEHVAVPPVPVNVPTYVVPLPVGMTPCVPLVSTVPIEVILPPTALVLFQIKLDVPPNGTTVGFALRVHVGVGANVVVAEFTDWADAAHGSKRRREKIPSTGPAGHLSMPSIVPSNAKPPNRQCTGKSVF